MPPAHQAWTSTRWSLSFEPSKRTRARSTRPESTSSIAQPTAGDALTATRPPRQDPDTNPPRVLMPRTSVDVPVERRDDGLPDGRLEDELLDGGRVVDEPLDGVPVGLPVGLPVADPVGAAGADEDCPAEETSGPVEIPAGSVKGSPTSPAAPKPTPTDAAAKTAHRAPSATRLSTRRSSPVHP
jgi:hypothetical protein